MFTFDMIGAISSEFFNSHRRRYAAWQVLPTSWSNLFENELVFLGIRFHHMLNIGHSSGHCNIQELFHIGRIDRGSMDQTILLRVRFFIQNLIYFQGKLYSMFVLIRTFFRIDNLWAYSVMIVISALSIYAIGLGKLFILELYLRGGFQLIALTEDLNHEIRNTNSIIAKYLSYNHFVPSSLILVFIWYNFQLPKRSWLQITCEGAFIIHFGFPSKNSWVRLEKNCGKYSGDLTIFLSISYFDLYFELVTGVVFFEFTTLYFLLGSTGFLVAQNVSNSL